MERQRNISRACCCKDLYQLWFLGLTRTLLGWHSTDVQVIVKNDCCSYCAAINQRRCNLLNLFLDKGVHWWTSHLLHSHSRARTVKHRTTKLCMLSWILSQHANWRKNDCHHVNENRGQHRLTNIVWPHFHGSTWKWYKINWHWFSLRISHFEHYKFIASSLSLDRTHPTPSAVHCSQWLTWSVTARCVASYNECM